MRYVLLLLVSLLSPVSSLAAPSEIVKEKIVSQGKERGYYLFVPDSVKAGTPAPLLVLLHGSGRNGHSLVEKWKDLARKEGIILAGPDSTDSSRWAVPIDGPEFLYDLIESLKSKYPVNPRRVYLFGHSAGASFSLQMSMFESKYFAATAIHAGALQKAAYVVIDYAKRRIPVSIIVGTNDLFFPLEVVRATRDELNKKEFSAELTEIPNHDHNYYGIAPRINGMAWEFLKKHELSEDPQYQQYDFSRR